MNKSNIQASQNRLFPFILVICTALLFFGLSIVSVQAMFFLQGLNDTNSSLVVETPQSYPIVGGTWTVELKTEGSENLLITGYNGTILSENDSADIRSLHLLCGTEFVDTISVENGIYIPNYHCDELTYHTVKVLTSGKHTQRFIFGNDINFAYNNATVNGSLTNLSVWNNGPLYMNNEARIYANYTNVASGNFLTGASCNISFSNSEHKMIELANLYNYNFTVSIEGNISYNVSCNISGYEWLNISDNVTFLSNTAPVINSFNPTETNISIKEPNNQIFNLTFTDNELNATITWYLNGTNQTTAFNVSQYTFLGNYTQEGNYNITAIIADEEFSNGIFWNLTVNNTNRTLLINYSFPELNLSIIEPFNQTFNITYFDEEGSASTTWYVDGVNQTSFFDFKEFNFTSDYDSAGVYNITALIQNIVSSDFVNWTLKINDTNQYPTLTNVAIYPNPAYTNSGLICNYSYSDLDGDSDDSYFAWFKNNSVIANGNFSSRYYSSYNFVDVEIATNYTTSGTLQNPSNGYDGNWNTFASGQSSDYILLNYSVPSNVNEASLQYKVDNTGSGRISGYCFDGSAWNQLFFFSAGIPLTLNVSLPSTCINSTVLQINYTFIGSPSNTGDLYESALWWNTTTLANITLATTEFAKHDDIICQITPYDGRDNGTAVNASTITISNTLPLFDDAPINSIISENELYSFDVNCSDSDGDVITYYDNASQWNIDSNTGIFSWTPQFSDSGVYQYNITCGDNNDNRSSYFNITVTNQNDIPQILTNYPSSSTVEIIEPENQTFNVTYSDAEGNATITWYLNGTNQSSYYNKDEFNFTGNYSVERIYNITVVIDDYEANDTFTWLLSINETNRAPTLTHGLVNLSVIENEELFYDINCSDADGNTTTYYSNATEWVINSSTGVINWTPSYIQSGDYNYNIICGDSLLNSSYELNISVNNSNRLPTISQLTVSPSISYTNDSLICSYEYSDLDKELDSSYFTWFRNDTVLNYSRVDSMRYMDFVAVDVENSSNYTIGSSLTNPENAYDEDVNTYAQGKTNAQIMINYSVPYNRIDGPFLQYKVYAALGGKISGYCLQEDEEWYEVFTYNALTTLTLNSSIPEVCLQENILQLNYTFDGGMFGARLYEEQMWWNESLVNDIVLDSRYFNKSDNITCEIIPNDGIENNTAENISLIISNTVPVIGLKYPNQTISISENELQQFNITYSDVDQDNIIISWLLNGSNQTTYFESSEFNFSSNYSSAGSYNITVIINDGNLTDWYNWSLVVNETNRAPVINVTAPVQNPAISEPNNQTFNISWFDLDLNSTSITWYLNGSEQLSYGNSLEYNFTGNYSTDRNYNVTVIIDDGNLIDWYNWSLTINETNHAPVINVTTPMQNPTISEPANQTFNISWYDLDLNSTSITWYLNGSEQSSYGNSLEYNFTGNYSTDRNYNVSVLIDDGNLIDWYNWSLTVDETNRAPVINVTYPTHELSIIEPINQTFNISWYDLDLNSTSITWYLNGSEQSSYGNSSEYNFTGNYSTDRNYNVSVLINDGNLIDWYNWSLTVDETNRAPVINVTAPVQNPAISEPVNQTFNISWYDLDLNSTSITWYLDDSNQITYSNSLEYNFTGNYSTAGLHNITVIIDDGNLIDWYNWSLTINETNRAPVINVTAPVQNPAISEPANQTFNISWYDLDLNSTSITWYLNGSEQSSYDNSLEYNFTGNYSTDRNYNVSFLINDSNLIDWYNWSLIVGETNRAPVINVTYPSHELSIIEPTNQTFNISLYDLDLNSTSITWYLNGSEQIEFSNKDEFNFSNNFSAQGIYNITVIVSDSLLSDWNNWTLIVNNSNKAPVMNHSLENVTGFENSVFIYDFNCSDPDDNTIIYYSNATKWNINSSTGMINWTPNFFDNNTYSYVITCGDGLLNSSYVLNITINNTNRLPTVSNLNITPTEAYTNSNLTCAYSYQDSDKELDKSYYAWFRDEALISSGRVDSLYYTQYIADDTEDDFYVITGTGLTNPENAHDENWNTATLGKTDAQILINYSIPYVANDVILDYKAFANSGSNVAGYCLQEDNTWYQLFLYSAPVELRLNATIPETCIQEDILQLNYSFFGNSGAQLFEEQVWWNKSLIQDIVLASSNFNRSDNVTCQITPNDNLDNGTAYNTSLLIKNTAPIFMNFSPSRIHSLVEPTNQTYNLSVFDLDSDSITFVWFVDGINQSSFWNESEFNFTSNYSAAGSYNVTIIIDDDNLTDWYNWSLTVDETNRAPVINVTAPVQNPTISEPNNQTFNISWYDFDLNSTSITWYLNGSEQSSYSDSLEYNFTGNYSTDRNYNVSVLINDGNLTDWYNWSLTVDETNRAPVINVTAPVQNPTIAEPANQTFNISWYDLDLNSTSITWYLNGSEQSSYGNSLEYNFTGNYSTDRNYNISVLIDDGNLIDWYNWSLTIDETNRAPVINVTAPVQNPAIFEPNNQTFNISWYDLDLNSTSITWYLNGSEQSSYSDSLEYNFTGNYSTDRNYNVSVLIDDGDLTDWYNWSLVVNETNRVPVINVTAPVQNPAIFEPNNQTFNISWYDLDLNSTSITWYLNGSEQSNYGNSLEYNFTGNYSTDRNYNVSVLINDGNLIDWYNWSLTIDETNRAPVINVTAPVQNPAIFEPNNQTFNISWFDLDLNSTSIIWYLNGNEQLSYGNSLEYNFTGNYSTDRNYNVSVLINDSDLIDWYNWSLVVNETNRAPVINSTYPTQIIAILEPENQTFNISWYDLDLNSTSITWYLNGTEQSDYGNSLVYNFTGNYSASGDYNVSVLLDDGNLFDSYEWNLSVLTKLINSTCNLTFSETTNMIYGIPLNVSCECSNPEDPAKLYRNGTDVTATENNKLILYNRADHEFVCNTSRTMNYNNASNSSVFTILKRSTNVSLSLNDIENNLSIIWPANVNATFWTTNYTSVLKRNETDISGENNTFIPLVAGYYNYSVINFGNNNFTGSEITYFVNISKNISILTLTNNVSWTINYSISTNISCNSNNNVNFSIFKNDIEISNPDVQILPVGTYNYVCNATSDENRTNATISNILTVLNTPPQITNATAYFNISILEPENQTFNISYIDLEGNATITWYVDGLNQTSVFNEIEYNFTGNYSSTGIYNITVNITDGEYFTWRNWTLIVNETNRAPVINVTAPVQNPAISEPANQTFNISWYDLDLNSTSITWYLNGSEQSSYGNSLEYNFTGNYSTDRNYNISVLIDDGALIDWYNWSLIVDETNRAPVINVTVPVQNPTISEPVNQTFNISWYDLDLNSTSIAWYLDDSNQITYSNSLEYNFTGNYSTAGLHNITVIIDDGNLTDWYNWSLTINETNRAPVINVTAPVQNPAISEPANQTFNISWYDLDLNSTSITWYLNGSEQSSYSNSLEYNFTGNYSTDRNYNISVLIDDGALIDWYNWSLTVDETNRAPVINVTTPMQNPTISEPANQTFNISWYDLDLNSTSITWYLNGSEQSSYGNSLEYNFTGNYSTDRNYNVSVLINDSELIDWYNWSLVVDETNRAPVINVTAPVQNPAISEPANQTFNISWYDLDLNSTSITWYLNGSEQSSYGNSLEYNFTGNYSTDRNYNISVLIDDGTLIDWYNWSLIVGEINRAPVINVTSPVQNPTIAEPANQTFNISWFDLDLNSTSITWYLNGSEQLSYGNSLEYNFTGNYSTAGLHNITVIIDDGALIDWYNWSLTINETNRAPVINVSAPVQNPAIFEPNNQTFNISWYDLDLNSTSITWYLNGSEQSSYGNSSEYNFTGNYSTDRNYNVSVLINDGNLIDWYNWSLTVDETNRAPVINVTAPVQNPAISEPANQTFNISWYDLDLNSTSITWYLNGSEQSSYSDSLEYNFTGNYSTAGLHNITVVIDDGNLIDWYNWSLIVGEINRAPVINVTAPVQNPAISEPANQTFNISWYDLDLNSTSITWYLNGSEQSSYGNSLEYNFTGNYSTDRNYNVSVLINDSDLIDWYNWSLVVDETNRAPVFNHSFENVIIYENETFIYDINASDADGNLTTYYDNSTLWNINASNGIINWTPSFFESGFYAYNITVGDSKLNYSNYFNITVLNANRFPVINYTYPSQRLSVIEPNNQTFNISWYDLDLEVITITWYINGTNQTPYFNSSEFNFIGNYSSQGIYNISTVIYDGIDIDWYNWTFSVNTTLINTTSNLSFLSTTGLMYGIPLNVSCDATNPEDTAKLYRNGTDVSAEINQFVILDRGDYEFVCNTTSTLNYRNSSNTTVFTIIPRPTTVNITLNGIEDNSSLVWPQTVNAQITTDNVTALLYRNSSDVTLENNTEISLAVGLYNYTVINYGNNNYTGSEKTVFVNVSRNVTSLTLSTNLSWTLNYSVVSSISCDSNNGVNFSLFRNGIEFSSPNVGPLPVGTYVYICNTTGDHNRTNNSVSNTLVVLNTPPEILTTAPIRTTIIAEPNNQTFTITTLDRETNATINWYINGTNQTSYWNSLEFNFTGNYTSAESYNVTVNISDGEYSDWYNWTLDVSNTMYASNCAITLLPSNNITYPSNVQATCTCDNDETNLQLFRNGTNVTSYNGLFEDVTAGAYTYMCNVSETTKFLEETVYKNFTLNKNITFVNLTTNFTNIIEGTPTKWIQYWNTSINVSCYADNDAPITIFKDGINLNTTFDVFYMDDNHTYECNVTNNQNYTYAYDTENLGLLNNTKPRWSNGTFYETTLEDNNFTNIDLYPFVSDTENADTELNFSVLSNSRPDIVSCSIVGDRYLDCDVSEQGYGTALLSVSAIDDESWHNETQFAMTITPVNDVPIITSVYTTETSLFRTDLFRIYCDANDVETASQSLAYTIQYNKSNNISWFDCNEQWDANLGKSYCEITTTVDDSELGSWSVNCSVTDGVNATNPFNNNSVLTVRNNLPEYNLFSPYYDYKYDSNENISFIVSVTDVEDGTLVNQSLVWTSDVDGNFINGTNVLFDGLTEGLHVLTLTINDSDEILPPDERLNITINVTSDSFDNYPHVKLTNPLHNETLNAQSVTLRCDVTEDNILLNTNLYTNISGIWAVAAFTATDSYISYSPSVTQGVDYQYNCVACDTMGQCNFAKYNNTFRLSYAPYCGDSSCNNGETCSTCPGDCGVCPPPAEETPPNDGTAPASSASSGGGLISPVVPSEPVVEIDPDAPITVYDDDQYSLFKIEGPSWLSDYKLVVSGQDSSQIEDADVLITKINLNAVDYNSSVYELVDIYNVTILNPELDSIPLKFHFKVPNEFLEIGFDEDNIFVKAGSEISEYEQWGYLHGSVIRRFREFIEFKINDEVEKSKYYAVGIYNKIPEGYSFEDEKMDVSMLYDFMFKMMIMLVVLIVVVLLVIVIVVVFLKPSGAAQQVSSKKQQKFPKELKIKGSPKQGAVIGGTRPAHYYKINKHVYKLEKNNLLTIENNIIHLLRQGVDKNEIVRQLKNRGFNPNIVKKKFSEILKFEKKRRIIVVVNEDTIKRERKQIASLDKEIIKLYNKGYDRAAVTGVLKARGYPTLLIKKRYTELQRFKNG